MGTFTYPITLRSASRTESETITALVDTVDAARLEAPKTKVLAQALTSLGLSRVLFIDGPELDTNFVRAASNLADVNLLPQQGANVYDILRCDTLVLTRQAVEHLEARLK